MVDADLEWRGLLGFGGSIGEAPDKVDATQQSHLPRRERDARRSKRHRPNRSHRDPPRLMAATSPQSSLKFNPQLA